MVADEIIRFMITEDMKPNDKLPTEKEISERLAIGRTSVREGLMKLESLGLVSRRQGHGIFINEITIKSYFNVMMHSPLADFINMDQDDFLDLLNVRFTLESKACLRAIDNIGDEDRNEFSRIYEQMAASNRNSKRFIDLDILFHEKLVKLSGSRIFYYLYTIISDLLSRQFKVTFEDQYLENVLADHKRILDAITEENGNNILESLSLHFDNVRKITMMQYRRQK